MLNKVKRNLIEKLKSTGHQDIIDQIKINKITFKSIWYPACTLLYLDHNFKYSQHIIFVDCNFLIVTVRFSDDEVCTILLHELGHIFNVPENHYENEDIHDFYADDFVRGLGFEGEFLTTLLKYQQWKNDNRQCTLEIEQRIKRIKEHNPILKGIILKK